MKQFVGKYGGLILGAFYGLALRLILDSKLSFDFADLFSITFMCIVPTAIGITPMLFASRERLENLSYRIWAPFLSVLLFFLFCYVTRLEDLICLIIIAVPFCTAALVAGFIFSWLILSYRRRNGIAYTVLLTPFLFGFFESKLETQSNSFEVISSTVISSKPDDIWKNVIRVKKMNEAEYPRGFFHYAGIPSPSYAELDQDTVGATRIGHFEGGLKFKEMVTTWEKDNQIVFDITPIPTTIGNTIFDRHILKGNHFKFLNATYRLIPISDQKTELILSSSYALDTNLNYYGSFWGNLLLSDFQERLLEVIKNRCENKTN